jgi:uncharacterized protein (TIGR00251 family)
MLSSETDSVLVAVRVKPRSSQSRIAGERAGRLLVEVAAPPVDGRANEAVCRLLASAIGVPASGVTVVAGARSRDKLLRIDAVTLERVAARLGASL